MQDIPQYQDDKTRICSEAKYGQFFLATIMDRNKPSAGD